MTDERTGRLPESAVLKYYLYKATKAVEFYRPVMYLYFLSQGLSFTQIALLEAAYNVTTVLGEVPTGYVGDRIGRRDSLLVVRSCCRCRTRTPTRRPTTRSSRSGEASVSSARP